MFNPRFKRLLNRTQKRNMCFSNFQYSLSTVQYVSIIQISFAYHLHNGQQNVRIEGKKHNRPRRNGCRFQFEKLAKRDQTVVVRARARAHTNGIFLDFYRQPFTFHQKPLPQRAVSRTPSVFRLRCLLCALLPASLRANTTLSVNNWPILQRQYINGRCNEERLRANTRGLCSSRMYLFMHAVRFSRTPPPVRDVFLSLPYLFRFFFSRLILETHSHVKYVYV